MYGNQNHQSPGCMRVVTFVVLLTGAAMIVAWVWGHSS